MHTMDNGDSHINNNLLANSTMFNLDLSVLFLSLDPICEFSCFTHKLIGFASLAQSLGSLLTQVQNVCVELFNLYLTRSH